MGRQHKFMAGMGPLREWWRQIRRNERAEARAQHEMEDQKRLRIKARLKLRPKCRCAAYRFPHRPGGGLCRFPDPPLATWQGQPGTNRPHGLRFRGLAKTLCNRYGLHPIRDRQRIERIMPRLRKAWLKRQAAFGAVNYWVKQNYGRSARIEDEAERLQMARVWQKGTGRFDAHIQIGGR